MKYNIVNPLIQGFVVFMLIAMALFIVFVVVCIVITTLRDSKQYQREQVLKGYRRAEAIMRRRLETSKETGVLYTKGNF